MAISKVFTGRTLREANQRAADFLRSIDARELTSQSGEAGVFGWWTTVFYEENGPKQATVAED